MNDTGPIPVTLPRADWTDVAAAVDQLPTHLDNPGLDALLRQLATHGLLNDAA